ncbi:MAG: M61 family metallopeptidase [Deltaproteobacteria bacterium]|nr:M61 family metallopeptidase [Deltaproteobacteria bacterium]
MGVRPIVVLWAVTLCVQARAETPAGAVRYTVRFPDPARQQVHVEVELSTTLPLSVVMPAWTPGAYRRRDWLRNVTPTGGRTASGDRLRWVRQGAAGWRIERDPPKAAGASPGPERVSVRYRVYAGELGDDTSHLDDRHAALSGPSVFVLLPEARQRPHLLRLQPPKGWRAAVPLPREGSAPLTYRARSYDELADAPIEVGTFVEATIRHGQARISVVLHDAEHRTVPKRLLDHIRRIVATQARWMGGLPYERYLLLIHTTDSERERYAALEHERGASIVIPRVALTNAEWYADLLYIVAHEHFHLWNGKRIRPSEHRVYDYAEPKPSGLLWFTEGVTDYFAFRTLRAAHLLSEPGYLAALTREINRITETPARLRQSLTDAARDAFWPPRDPAEPALSIYAKGHLVALLLDLELRARSGGRTTLLGLLKQLDRRAAASGVVGLGRSDLDALLRSVGGAELVALLASWVDRPGELGNHATLTRAGLTLRKKPSAVRPHIGLVARRVRDELEVTAVVPGSPAMRAGVVRRDRILTIDGAPPGPGWVRDLWSPGPHRVVVSRRGERREVLLEARSLRGTEWLLSCAPPPSPAARLVQETWLAGND